MRFSHVAIVYFLMGAAVATTGVVPAGAAGPGIGITGVFMDTAGDGVAVNETAVGGSGGGLLDNLIGPVKNALQTVAGGALLAAWEPVSTLLGFYAWPVTVTNYLGAPDIVVMLAGALVASFTFGALRVIRASV